VSTAAGHDGPGALRPPESVPSGAARGPAPGGGRRRAVVDLPLTVRPRLVASDLDGTLLPPDLRVDPDL